MADVPVWFITGCSTGFGRELAKLVLKRGWKAVVTARDPHKIADIVDAHPDNAVALALDVTSQVQVEAAVADAISRFGHIDVLVNNAGYGYQTSVEEGVDDEIRAMFDANVFGLAAMIRAVLPGMRARKSGHIINVTSVGGLIGFAASGYYSATKHAVEGLSDALKKEVAPLGIKVICVEPGPFRTDWAGRSLKQTESRIADYAETVQARMKATSGVSGKQPGDPVRAGLAIIKAVESKDPPLHLVLGQFGIENVTAKLKDTLEDIETWKQAGLDADYPQNER
ncbi:MAG TPA: oxidoreductase [Stellaceae bacterium]|jgi:NAD(P)-dependent dehydrogenase (short-subunit alcohol dehydrogenase family)|nr:oxidoreductase [Stellaceae bacterium]